MKLINRALSPAVALETTLIVHGVPRSQSASLLADLSAAVRKQGAHPATIGIFAGQPIVGLTDSEIREMLTAPFVQKVNSSNLGLAIHRKLHAATTVSTTLELASAAGIRVFATGGLGGMHKGFAQHADISSDLQALTRFPLAVVTSGVKSLLDVAATREALETLGVCVVGWKTDRFPAFYLRELEGVGDVDARFDSVDELADFLRFELARSGRSVVVCNPIPESAALPAAQFLEWLSASEGAVLGSGRQRTPAVLSALHRLSGGRTLEANIALARSNATLAGALATRVASHK